jgi:adenine C2-methylase RlmN of 23S rRNA A2503 and tRNA A37
MLTKKVFVTAECSRSSKEARSKFYTNLENNGFEVDIRGTKKKKVFCPSG